MGIGGLRQCERQGIVGIVFEHGETSATGVSGMAGVPESYHGLEVLFDGARGVVGHGVSAPEPVRLDRAAE
jgi:hypothetical protein